MSTTTTTNAQIAVPERYPGELAEVLADAAGALSALAQYLDGPDIQRIAERCAAFAGVKVGPDRTGEAS
jgi:hypothetical protein